MLVGGASCICSMYFLSPRVQPDNSGSELDPSFQYPQIPTHINSHMHINLTPVHLQLVTAYPWRPPLSTAPDAAVSIGKPGHLCDPALAYIYVHPFPYIILLSPLHNAAIVTIRRATAASRRHCPGSSGTHLSTALEPPCAAPGMPILTPSSTPVLISPLEHIPRFAVA
jgi:hypothetical protein